MQGTRERPLAAFSSLHTALASLQIKKAHFFFVTVSNKRQKISSTANCSFHRHQNTKMTLWTCWLLSQKLVWTSWNREDTEGLCTFSGSWWSQKHVSQACYTGVTQPNQMLYWVPSLLLLTIPPHTHSGKTYFNWSQRSPSNPSFGSPLKEKSFFTVFPSSGTRGSRSSQAWRPQVRKMAQLVFPEASLLCTACLCWKEAQAERCAQHRRDTGPTHSFCCLCL